MTYEITDECIFFREFACYETDEDKEIIRKYLEIWLRMLKKDKETHFVFEDIQWVDRPKNELFNACLAVKVKARERDEKLS